MVTSNLQNLDYGIVYISNGTDSALVYQVIDRLASKVYPMEIMQVDPVQPGEIVIAARRFNVGNVGHYATVRLVIHGRCSFDADLQRFVRALMDVASNDVGDVEFNAWDDSVTYMERPSRAALPQAAPQDNTRVKSRRGPNLWSWIKKKKTEDVKQDDVMSDDLVLCDIVEDDTAQNLDVAACSSVAECFNDADVDLDLLDEEDQELNLLAAERKRALERIKRDIVNYIARYHDDPKDLMAELLRGKVVVGHPGRVLVNGDMKIVLPDYDEMEIEMPAMCRTLYILFMKRRLQGGGIVLKNIDEYRDEIINIYSMVKPGASEYRVTQTVNNLCDPFSDSLNQMISKVNRCIKNVVTDKVLASQYIIKGRKGEPYSVGIEPEYLELPRAVTGE